MSKNDDKNTKKKQTKRKNFIKFRKTIILNFEKRLLKISKNNYFEKFKHFCLNFHFRFFSFILHIHIEKEHIKIRV